jgi:hypothetical protein
VKSKNRRFIVKWRASKGVSGYQVVYKKKSAKKYRTLKFIRKTKVISKKLKKGRKYRFRVRAYTKINGKKVYGPYTKARTIKCK